MLNVVVVYAAQGAMVLAVILLIGILAERLTRHYRERRLERGIQIVLPPLFQHLHDDLSLKRLMTAAAGQRTALKHLLLILTPQLEGALRQRLRLVAEEAGFIKQALRAARSGDARIAEIATMQLGLWRTEEAVPVVTRLLRSPSRSLRYTAARSLALIGSPEVLRVLLKLMLSPQLVDTTRVLEMVERLPRPDVSPLEERVRDVETPIESRLLLIDMIGDWREHRLIPLLRDLLWNDNAEIVLRAIKALNRIGDIDGLPIMLQLIDHPRWEVRAQVVKAVGTLGFTDALPLMRAALADRSYWVRHNAAVTLSILGGEALTLLDPERHVDRFARDMARYQGQRTGLSSIAPRQPVTVGGQPQLIVSAVGEAR